MHTSPIQTTKRVQEEGTKDVESKRNEGRRKERKEEQEKKKEERKEKRKEIEAKSKWISEADLSCEQPYEWPSLT